MKPIRLLLIDDHAIVRQGLKLFLELTEDFEIVGEGETGEDAVRRAAELRPDIILLDLAMPGMNGIEAARSILQADPEARIMILTSFSDSDDVFAAVRAGAKGYLLKDVPPEQLAQSLREVYQGKVQLHPEIAKKLMEGIKEPAESKSDRDPLIEDLTKRELDVLLQIGRGLSNREIAAELSISHKTVKTHVSNLLGKLQLNDRTQAAIFAIKQGLIPDED